MRFFAKIGAIEFAEREVRLAIVKTGRGLPAALAFHVEPIVIGESSTRLRRWRRLRGVRWRRCGYVPRHMCCVRAVDWRWCAGFGWFRSSRKVAAVRSSWSRWPFRWKSCRSNFVRGS